MIPLLTVVVPTHKRPELLTRAIESSILAAPDRSLEVIVIPNGADDSWRRVAERFREDRRVSWIHNHRSNASAARNMGLRAARGKYVRFLDDDDYLFPAASDQLTSIESSGSEICSAPLMNILPSGREGEISAPHASEDFVTAALMATSVSLCQGSIFLRSAISNVHWREDAVLYDDYLWILDLASQRDFRWSTFPPATAAYVHHYQPRLSYTRRSRGNTRQLISNLMALHAHLVAARRSNAERTRALACALKTHAHSSFPADPFFLSPAIRFADSLDESSAPQHPLFVEHPWLAHNMLAAEWAFLLPRYLTRGLRRLGWALRGNQAV